MLRQRSARTRRAGGPHEVLPVCFPQRRARRRHDLCVALFSWIAAAALPAAAQAASPLCAPRIGEKLGVPFVEVCASRASEVLGEDPGRDRVLPSLWIAAVPLACAGGRHEALDCPTVTALEASPVGSRFRNRPLRAAVVDAATAHRLCTLRFGGRLPTPEEREQARHVLGLVSLLVREDGARGDRVLFDELPEWVAASECAAMPSSLAPDCRVSLSPPVIPRPRRRGDALLACDAELADFGAEPSVPIGGGCEAELLANARRPRCAPLVPHAAYPARFTLRCRAALLEPGDAARQPSASEAAFRCVVPESALGRLGEPAAQREPPRAPKAP